MKYLKWAFLLILFSQAASAKVIIFDLRGSRGGHGDVAAGYLTALDLMRSPGFSDEIILIGNETEIRIVSKFVGKNLTNGQAVFDKMKIYDASAIPNNMKPGDIVIQMAAADAETRFEDSFRRVSTPPSPYTIPITDRAAIVTLPVLGNTESDDRSVGGTIRIENQEFHVKSPGVANSEGGIYYDPTAVQLSGRSQAEIRQFIQANLNSITDDHSRKALTDLLNGSGMNGSKIGLAYGISADSTAQQFNGYLNGVSESLEKSGESVVIVTPSDFKIEKMSPGLRGKVIFLKRYEELPKIPKKGIVYILETATLPQNVFTGLMAYSEIPPVIAGDGAMSAAITLKKPFVMPKVPHNKHNISAMRDRLLEGVTDPKQRELIQKLFPATGAPDMSQALELNTPAWKVQFERIGQSTPALTQKLLKDVATAQAVVEGGNFGAIDQIKDNDLQLSVLGYLMEKNDPRAVNHPAVKAVRKRMEQRLSVGEVEFSDDRFLRLITKDPKFRDRFLNSLDAQPDKSWGNRIGNLRDFCTLFRKYCLETKMLETEFAKLMTEKQYGEVDSYLNSLGTWMNQEAEQASAKNLAELAVKSPEIFAANVEHDFAMEWVAGQLTPGQIRKLLAKASKDEFKQRLIFDAVKAKPELAKEFKTDLLEIFKKDFNKLDEFVRGGGEEMMENHEVQRIVAASFRPDQFDNQLLYDIANRLRLAREDLDPAFKRAYFDQLVDSEISTDPIIGNVYIRDMVAIHGLAPDQKVKLGKKLKKLKLSQEKRQVAELLVAGEVNLRRAEELAKEFEEQGTFMKGSPYTQEMLKDVAKRDLRKKLKAVNLCL